MRRPSADDDESRAILYTTLYCAGWIIAAWAVWITGAQ